MVESEGRQRRTRDAQKARDLILDAAEAVFAEHGFDGARVDAIAKASGYNTSLLFQYFGDKLGLYVEVIKRADRELNALQGRVLAPLIGDETVAENVHTFKRVLETVVGAFFDYLVEHPRFVRMMLWEQAAGWETYARIISQFVAEEGDPFEKLFQRAYRAGLLRSNFAPLIQLSMILQICIAYLTFIPLYQMVLPGEDLSSAQAMGRAREYIVTLVVAGMMVDAKDKEG